MPCGEHPREPGALHLSDACTETSRSCRFELYDATLLRSTDALEVDCKLARSFLDAFDVARLGSVALDRISFGRRPSDTLADDPLGDGEVNGLRLLLLELLDIIL